MKKCVVPIIIAIIIMLVGCSTSKEGIEKDIAKFPTEIKKDSSVFVLEKPELYYYDTDEVHFGICILKMDISKAEKEDSSLLNESALDDYESFHASVYYDSEENNVSMASMEPVLSKNENTTSTFVFCTDASEKTYSDMKLYLSISTVQDETYTVKTDNGSYEKNKENKYTFRGNSLNDDKEKDYAAQSYEMIDKSLWESISSKLDFTNPTVKVSNYEEAIREKVSSKLSGTEQGTNEALDAILRLAKLDSGEATEDDISCAFQVIKKYYPNYFSDYESIELIIYCGALLDYATEDYLPESKVGFKAIECTKYVYQGTEEFDSEENKLHLEKLNEYIKEYELINK